MKRAGIWCIVGLVSIAAAGAACSRRDTPESSTAAVTIRDMSVEDVAGRLARGEPLAVIDVNRRSHYETGHIPGARWMVHNRVQATDLPADRNTPLVFYCYNEH